jgi:hypothetical protein
MNDNEQPKTAKLVRKSFGKSLHPKDPLGLDLDRLLDLVNDQNRHDEVATGDSVGNEYPAAVGR